MRSCFNCRRKRHKCVREPGSAACQYCGANGLVCVESPPHCTPYVNNRKRLRQDTTGRASKSRKKGRLSQRKTRSKGSSTTAQAVDPDVDAPSSAEATDIDVVQLQRALDKAKHRIKTAFTGNKRPRKDFKDLSERQKRRRVSVVKKIFSEGLDSLADGAGMTREELLKNIDLEQIKLELGVQEPSQEDDVYVPEYQPFLEQSIPPGPAPQEDKKSPDLQGQPDAEENKDVEDSYDGIDTLEDDGGDIDRKESQAPHPEATPDWWEDACRVLYVLDTHNISLEQYEHMHRMAQSRPSRGKLTAVPDATDAT